MVNNTGLKCNENKRDGWKMNNVSSKLLVSIPYLMRKYKVSHKKACEMIQDAVAYDNQIDPNLPLPEWIEKFLEKEHDHSAGKQEQ